MRMLRADRGGVGNYRLSIGFGAGGNWVKGLGLLPLQSRNL